MQIVDRTFASLDTLQRRYRLPGFIYAVIKKYGEDESPYLCALITYYGFLSLFPLLIVATSLLQITGSSQLKVKIINALLQYFPIIGQHLQANVSGLSRNGIGLVIGIIVTFYGARGIADALRYSLDQIWQVPRKKRRGFPGNLIASSEIIFLGAVGLITADILSSLAASLNKSSFFRVIASVVSAAVLFLVLIVIFRIATTSHRISRKTLILSASLAAIGIQVLHLLGGYIITHELKHLSSLYGVFALVLGMLFWIYLQAQVLLYALEIGSVQALKLWPRSLTGHNQTSADKHAYSLYRKRERLR